MDFVGPHDDVYDIHSGQPTHWYVDPGFDQDHAAQRGMRFDSLETPIGELVEEFAPDIVVVMLGVNDVVFSVPQATGEVVDERLRDFVAEARAADPEVSFVASRIPQGWFEEAAAYNALVPDTAAELSTEESPIAVAAPDDGFDQPDDVWDTVHPNARGEVQIAAAVADALAELGVGDPAPRPLPDVDVGPRFAPSLTVVPGDRSAQLTWLNPPGVLEEIVEMRDVTAGEGWAEHGSPSEESGLVVSGLVNGHTYAFRLRPKRGYWAAPPDVRSPTVAVVPAAS